MKAYLVSAIQIHDREKYSEYIDLAKAALAPFNFKRLAIDPDPTVYEGEKPANHHMLAEFESMEELEAFYNSEAYQKVIEVRQRSSTVQFLMAMKGIEP